MPTSSLKNRKITVIIFVIVVAILLAAGAYLLKKDKDSNNSALVMPGGEAAEMYEPKISSTEIISGYSNIWDMFFIDSNTLLFNERSGKLHGMKLDTKEKWEVGSVPNVLAEGEGGLMGMTYDVEFATNKYVYACYNAAGRTRAVKVTRFKLSDDFKSASEFTDIITNIQSQAGRHSGCRLTMDGSKHLWVATGDSAIGGAPQDPKSLAGKVLRVDRDGKGVEGNAAAPFDNRIFNYGHRNVQGIVLLRGTLPNGAVGLTSEHGPDKQDELNWLMPGNFGWNPNGAKGAYDESVPMTDKSEFPEAIDAVWNSGNSTIAVSGITFLTSSKWSQWQGWVAMTALKGEQVRLLEITGEGLKSEKTILSGEFGRIRTAAEGPDGDLFITTDNGDGKDKIIRVTPSKP